MILSMPATSMASTPPSLRALGGSLRKSTPAEPSPTKAEPLVAAGPSPAGRSSHRRADDVGIPDITGTPRRRLSGQGLGLGLPDVSPTPSLADTLDSETTSCSEGGRALSVGSAGNTAHFHGSRNGFHLERRPSTAGQLEEGLVPSEGTSLDLSLASDHMSAKDRGMLGGGLTGTSFHLGREQYASERQASLFQGATFALTEGGSTSPPRVFRRGSTERMHERAKPEHLEHLELSAHRNIAERAASRSDGTKEWCHAKEQIAALPVAGLSRHPATRR